MNLKEAFRYQNFLDRMMSTANSYLSRDRFVTVVNQTHMRKKAYNEADDETLKVEIERPFHCEVKDLVDVLVALLSEKTTCCASIDAAKNGCGVPLDSAIALNKSRQSVAHTLTSMANIAASERMARGTAYKFNAEGNQVPYSYDVKEVTTIDFDRNKVKDLSKKLLGEADKWSADVDRLMVEVVVQMDPRLDVNDSFEDVVEKLTGVSR